MITLFLFSLLFAALGTAGAYFQILFPEVGAMLVAGGAALMTLGFVINLLLLMGRSGRGSALIFLLGLPATAGTAFLAFQRVRVPISDVTTNLQTPPKFEYPLFPFPVEKGGEYLDPSLKISREYDQSVSATQARMFPDLNGIKVKASGPETYAAILKVVKDQLPNWKIVVNDTKHLHAEFAATQMPLRLITDVAVHVDFDPRIPDACEVEIRSRARFPLADFGWAMLTLEDLQLRVRIATKALEEETAHKAALAEARGQTNGTAAATPTGTSTSTATAAVPPPAPAPAPPPAPAPSPAPGMPAPSAKPANGVKAPAAPPPAPSPAPAPALAPTAKEKTK